MTASYRKMSITDHNLEPKSRNGKLTKRKAQRKRDEQLELTKGRKSTAQENEGNMGKQTPLSTLPSLKGLFAGNNNNKIILVYFRINQSKLIKSNSINNVNGTVANNTQPRCIVSGFSQYISSV